MPRDEGAGAPAACGASRECEGVSTPVGTLTSLTTWPVKSLGGGTAHAAVPVDESGLAGDRRYGVRDARGVLSARSAPRLLQWSAADGAGEPLVTRADGRQWAWSEPGLAAALSDDLGRPVELSREPAGCQDLERSVLVTTTASHRAVEQALGAPLEVTRWRTNVHLDAPELPPLAEHGWEGRRLLIGDVVLRLLHPCARCTIPTYAPGGLVRNPELLRLLSAGERAGPFGINARVEVPGVLERGGDVVLV